MKRNALYIHGFRSSAKCNTAKSIEKSCKHLVNLYTVDVTANAEESLKILQDAIEENDIDLVIGTSLGGYYALKLKEHYAKINSMMQFIDVLAVNPVVDTEAEFEDKVGEEFTYFYERENGDETFTFTEEDFDTLVPVDVDMFKGNDITNTTWIVYSERDNVLPGEYLKYTYAFGDHAIARNEIRHSMDPVFISKKLPALIEHILDQDSELYSDSIDWDFLDDIDIE